MRFKIWPQLPETRRTRAGHHHGSHTPTSPEAILLGKVAHHTNRFFYPMASAMAYGRSLSGLNFGYGQNWKLRLRSNTGYITNIVCKSWKVVKVVKVEKRKIVTKTCTTRPNSCQSPLIHYLRYNTSALYIYQCPTGENILFWQVNLVFDH